MSSDSAPPRTRLVLNPDAGLYAGVVVLSAAAVATLVLLRRLPPSRYALLAKLACASVVLCMATEAAAYGFAFEGHIPPETLGDYARGLAIIAFTRDMLVGLNFTLYAVAELEFFRAFVPAATASLGSGPARPNPAPLQPRPSRHSALAWLAALAVAAVSALSSVRGHLSAQRVITWAQVLFTLTIFVIPIIPYITMADQQPGSAWFIIINVPTFVLGVYDVIQQAILIQLVFFGGVGRAAARVRRQRAEYQQRAMREQQRLAVIAPVPPSNQAATAPIRDRSPLARGRPTYVSRDNPFVVGIEDIESADMHSDALLGTGTTHGANFVLAQDLDWPNQVVAAAHRHTAGVGVATTIHASPSYRITRSLSLAFRLSFLFLVLLSIGLCVINFGTYVGAILGSLNGYVYLFGGMPPYTSDLCIVGFQIVSMWMILMVRQALWIASRSRDPPERAVPQQQPFQQLQPAQISVDLQIRQPPLIPPPPRLDARLPGAATRPVAADHSGEPSSVPEGSAPPAAGSADDSVQSARPPARVLAATFDSLDASRSADMRLSALDNEAAAPGGPRRIGVWSGVGGGSVDMRSDASNWRSQGPGLW
ncbi:hypothetical protein HK105_202939 [Polyrhizophydium stewartii]|uniref:Proteophosphoglycan ppg4 n=1 Tax=Polyrhizophydium stewartii TaxID=2732419 RepID=A0ABR4NDT8_9FUNG